MSIELATGGLLRALLRPGATRDAARAAKAERRAQLLATLVREAISLQLYVQQMRVMAPVYAAVWTWPHMLRSADSLNNSFSRFLGCYLDCRLELGESDLSVVHQLMTAGTTLAGTFAPVPLHRRWQVGRVRANEVDYSRATQTWGDAFTQVVDLARRPAPKRSVIRRLTRPFRTVQ